MNREYQSQQKHLVAVDCVIFGYENYELKLLLFHRGLQPAKGEWSLIGGWVDANETIEGAAERVMKRITGLHNISMQQVSVFSEPNRDPGGRVISVVFNALIDINKQNQNLVREFGAHWWPIDKVPKLIFDHDKMVDAALHKLRTTASYQIVGKDLLPDEFTLTQLRQLYNCIYMKDFDPGNFRKKILSLKILERTNRKDQNESKKGAYYYRFRKGFDNEFTDRIIKYTLRSKLNEIISN